MTRHCSFKSLLYASKKIYVIVYRKSNCRNMKFGAIFFQMLLQLFMLVEERSVNGLETRLAGTSENSEDDNDAIRFYITEKYKTTVQ